MLLAASLWSGCTAEKKYKVLSFFFDGVPDPNAPAVDLNASVAVDERGKPVHVVLHKPYADNNCAVCHGSAKEFSDFTKIPSTVCITCHTKIPNQYPIMHGPVSAVECNWCHTPHESQNDHLLKIASPDVCVQCHEPALLPAKVPEHLLAERSCLDCHFAHGGQKHGFLRPVFLSNATTAPTTPPATGPTTAPISGVPQ